MLNLLVSRITEDFPIDFAELGEEWLTAFVIIFAVFGLLAFGFLTVIYVLHSLGLYTIAERRGIHHGWLAWLPVGNVWVLGSISDQYQYLVKGRIKNRRRILTGMSVLLGILLIAFLASLISMMLSVLNPLLPNGEPSSLAVALLITSALMMVPVSVVIMIYQYLACYDLYRSCQPDNAVVYLLLSIVASVAMPFLVFSCRNKDLGMPPRKQPKPQPAPEPQAVSAEEEKPAEQEEACEAAPEEPEESAHAEEAEPEKPVEE